MSSKLILLIFSSLFFLGKVSAGENTKIESLKTPPLLDGRVDEIYKSGVLFNSFVQLEPNIFAQPSVKTEIYFLYDKENIYIAGNLYQPRMSIKTNNGRKDSPIILDGDAIGIVIDPLNNGNSAYFFAINPSNSAVDGTLNANGNWDFKWDAIFNSVAKIEDDYWSFEIQLPLSSISFQDKEEQDWGILIRREYSPNKEIILNNIVDKNQPFRISDFVKIKSLKGLRKENQLFVTPYSFYSFKNNFIGSQKTDKIKFGGEIKYNPVSSMTLIATINPDYAQIETDKLIINVDDVPASYPEKRPFFTESSDLYPGLAVNTRNIEDIDVGIKLRDVRDNLKYDLTWILDRKQNKWYMGDFRITDNETYYVDLIGGVKNQPTRTDYNFTTNLRTWLFDKRLTAYTWFGTINKQNAKNEYESVNSVRWVTREFTFAYWNHFKTQFYNPNITGHNTLSNQILHHAWIIYSFFDENSLFRVITPKFKYEYNTLYTDPKYFYSNLIFSLETTMYLNEYFGNWNLSLSYIPTSKKLFRHRTIQSQTQEKTFEDAFSKFVLVEQNRAVCQIILNTDFSKTVGLKFNYNNFERRKSAVDNLVLDTYWRFSPTTNVTYSLENIRLYGSEYQTRFFQTLHRIKFEHNLTDKINLRAIVQLNNVEIPDNNGLEQNNPVINFTASYEYMKGSYIYFVFNKEKLSWFDNSTASTVKINNQSIALKLNCVFNM
ncbi:MAG: DUF5916 domain-containing protein [Bacteroidota bacterium]